MRDPARILARDAPARETDIVVVGAGQAVLPAEMRDAAPVLLERTTQTPLTSRALGTILHILAKHG